MIQIVEDNTIKLSKSEAIQELWARGFLKYKLDSTQKELYDLFYNSNHKIMVWLLSRRQGKTFTLCVLAIEQCLRKTNSIVKFVAPTKAQVSQIVRPILRKILEDCPDYLKPEWRKNDSVYYFPNGSEIQLAGTDSGHAERLRGGDSDLFFVDEAGTCSDLNNIVKSILLPTTLITNGRGVLASTPPKEADHDFIKYIEDSERRNSLIKKTVFDNPRITKEQLNELIKELGGLHTEEARRELLCELIKDPTTSVIPEFNDELQNEIVKEYARPPFFDNYVAMDIGFKDLTVLLFAYYDFKEDKVIIEDEMVVNFQTADINLKSFSEAVLKKEEELYKNPLTHEIKKPYKRVTDINYIALQEMHKHSNWQLYFENAEKYDNDSAINTMRLLLGNKKVIINPKCKTLIRHLRNVRWQKNKKVFARSADDGHYDAVDALKYLLRSIQYKKNPYPPGYGLHTKDLFGNTLIPSANYTNNTTEIFKKIFNVKPKRKF